MCEDIKFSIVIPIYNSGRCLQDCLESIVSQTYHNIEIVLVDDGSTDISREICDQFTRNDGRIKVVHQENQGVSISRNNGIDNSTGDVILFVDSDDIISENFVSSFYIEGFDYTKSIIMQGCYVKSANIQYVHQFNDYIVDKKYFAEAIADEKLFMHGGPCCKSYSAKVIKGNNIHFRKDIRNYEDFMFLMDYIKCIESICFSSNLGYYYLIHSGGLHETRNSITGEKDVLDHFLSSISEYRKDQGYNRIIPYAQVFLFRLIMAIIRTNMDWHLLKSTVNEYKYIVDIKPLYLGKKDKLFRLCIRCIIKMVELMN